MRGQHIGEKLVLDCLQKAKELGFRVLQFNAVVESNLHARHLYERLGFVQFACQPPCAPAMLAFVGDDTMPNGFRGKHRTQQLIQPSFGVAVFLLLNYLFSSNKSSRRIC